MQPLTEEYELILDELMTIFTNREIRVNRTHNFSPRNFNLLAENHEVSVSPGPDQKIYLTYKAVRVQGLRNFGTFFTIADEIRAMFEKNMIEDELNVDKDVSGVRVYTCSIGFLGVKKEK